MSGSKLFLSSALGDLPIIGKQKDVSAMSPTDLRMFSLLQEWATKHRRIAILCTLCMKEIKGENNGAEINPTLQCECRQWKLGR